MLILSGWVSRFIIEVGSGIMNNMKKKVNYRWW